MEKVKIFLSLIPIKIDSCYEGGSAQCKTVTIIRNVFCIGSPSPQGSLVRNVCNTASNEGLGMNLLGRYFSNPQIIACSRCRKRRWILNQSNLRQDWEIWLILSVGRILIREDRDGNACAVWSLCESWPWLMMAGGGGVSRGKKPRLY